MASRSCPSAVRLASIVSLLMVLVGCRDTRGTSGSSQDAANPNAAAWQVALKAESERTFRDARYLLSQIDMSTVTDQDLREIIEYQRRLCNFCIDTGVPKDAKMDMRSMLSSINYKTLAQTLIDKGITKAHQETMRLADEGAALTTGLDKYLEVREILSKRYH